MHRYCKSLISPRPWLYHVTNMFNWFLSLRTLYFSAVICKIFVLFDKNQLAGHFFVDLNCLSLKVHTISLTHFVTSIVCQLPDVWSQAHKILLLRLLLDDLSDVGSNLSFHSLLPSYGHLITMYILSPHKELSVNETILTLCEPSCYAMMLKLVWFSQHSLKSQTIIM